ncbi:unnamed protein product [Cercopithifilaria johnstoni]|uniref:Uncharacterized protein n=1 Tax=Cercopithifilaria johnstoni TaxID=2874296 RepID=A0A8J2Q4U0_9BILA|nr:unnamed protein product [Cercopithifilaria johnstoni]
MANTYTDLSSADDTDDKFIVTMSTDKLQTVCNQMEDDDPEAEDDEPVSFVVWDTQVTPFTSDLIDEAINDVDVVDISTPSATPSGISEYLMIMPRRHHRAHLFDDENLTSSSNLSQSSYSQR